MFLSLSLFSQPEKSEYAPTSSGYVCSTDLTDNEKADLIYMREEEKLARDVYLYSLDLYGMQIFSNISKSEQRHMDLMLDLLTQYNIPDPASEKQGVFTNADLQVLYNDLTAKSQLSLLDALLVGASIEDLDIRDLDNCLAKTEKTAVVSTYEKLSCASGNHIRAFSRQIINKGGMYMPHYLTDQKYKEIISADHEKCGQQ